jgi:hypothetical protein
MVSPFSCGSARFRLGGRPEVGGTTQAVGYWCWSFRSSCCGLDEHQHDGGEGASRAADGAGAYSDSKVNRFSVTWAANNNNRQDERL